MIGPGERAPDFVLRLAEEEERVRFYGRVGGTPALLVLTAGDGEAAARVAAAWRATDHPAFLIAAGDAAAATPGAGVAGFRDADGAVHRAYGVDAAGPAVAVLLDANVRVAAAEPLADGDGEETAARLAATASTLAQATAAGDEGHAPVLYVPRVLDEALCAELIAHWHDAAAAATGVEASVGSARAETVDAQRKRRRDLTVADETLLRRLTGHVGRRVMPELRKAFAYRATRFEGFKIGCYDASDAGFFDAHRDNLSPATAHRRFGLTLNLNADYEGGELVFPEYGTRRHRPAAGEALVFSGSHLHEVLPVTRGRRFVLLSFLYGDEQAAQRS